MNKYLKYGIAVFVIALIISFIVFENLYPTPSNFPISNYKKPILIAHAGGGINNEAYTNSLEAINLSAENKYEFIELDLTETTDGKVIAMHSPKDFYRQSGIDTIEDFISYDYFKKQKLFGTMHPLTSEDINHFFGNKDIILVTDKLADFSLLNKEINVHKEQMLVEVFSYKKYVEALKNGIKYPMLNIWTEEHLDYYTTHFRLKRIKMITIPIELIESSPNKLQSIHDMGICIFAFTSNDKDFILKNGGKTVSGFYTDFVTYKDLYPEENIIQD